MNTNMSLKRTLIASAIMIFTVMFLKYINHTEKVLPNKSFSNFPKQIGDWRGRELHFNKEIYEVLGADDSYLGHYQTAAGGQIQLYIGFYQSQKEGDIIHSPKNCMPGAGWQIVRSSIIDLTAPESSNKVIKAIKFSMRMGNEEHVVLYWYQSRGRIISSEYWQKIYLVIDSIIRQRTDGSFIRLIAPVSDGNEEAALAYLKDFANLIFPILNEYIPA
jgi:EpsI family protein